MRLHPIADSSVGTSPPEYFDERPVAAPRDSTVSGSPFSAISYGLLELANITWVQTVPMICRMYCSGRRSASPDPRPLQEIVHQDRLVRRQAISAVKRGIPQ
jgi:hypothetical protein